MNLSKFLQELEKKDGPVRLLMILGGNQGPNTGLNLLISTKKLDSAPLAFAINKVAEIARKTIPKKDIKALSRITVLQGNDPFVKTMNAMFRIDGDGSGGAIFNDCNFNGMHIEYAQIYKSVANAEVDAEHNQPQSSTVGA
jgi:hypothetical protein